MHTRNSSRSSLTATPDNQTEPYNDGSREKEKIRRDSDNELGLNETITAGEAKFQRL
jgi:hypothetical protein